MVSTPVVRPISLATASFWLSCSLGSTSRHMLTAFSRNRFPKCPDHSRAHSGPMPTPSVLIDRNPKVQTPWAALLKRKSTIPLALPERAVSLLVPLLAPPQVSGLSLVVTPLLMRLPTSVLLQTLTVIQLSTTSTVELRCRLNL